VFDVIAAAVGDYLLERLPETRRGRIALAIFMVVSIGVAVAAVIVVLSR
jgi:hypothetical protein